MEKLQWIEIENFRGIKHARLEDFKDINVFIGRNNTGKSTVLEAIYLNVLWDNKSNMFFRDFFKVNNPIIIIGNKRKRNFDEYWAYKKNFPIRINSNISSLELKLGVGYSDKSEFRRVVLLYPELYLLPFYPILIRRYLADFGMDAIEKICKFLTERLKLEEELGYIEEREQKLYFIFKTKAVPFENVGDGLKTAFVILAICSYLSDGIILLEEPEVHQHPGSLKLIVESIVHSAKNNRNQIFITTHSLEFLEMLLEKAKQENVDVNVYNFKELKDGELIYKLYSLEDAYTAVNEIGIDLR